MSVTDVKQALFQTNLNFDPNMATEVFVFLTSNGIELDHKNIHLQSNAAAAILSQTKLVPKINQQGYMRYGVTIQTVMSHLNGQSKEQFLQVLSSLLLKSQIMHHKLSSKIRSVQLSYRLFKKYRKSFQQLWSFTGICTLVMNDMLSIFWVIYLLVKNKSDQVYADLHQQIKLIIVLIKGVFQYWVGQVQIGLFNKTIQANFNIHSMAQIDEEFFLMHHLRYLNQIQKLYSMRYQNMTIDFRKFLRNAIQIARYLDDVTNYFYRQKQFFQVENYIDEISYLQLKKTLAPKPLNKQATVSIQPIQKCLNFSSSQSLPSQHESKKQNLNNQSNLAHGNAHVNTRVNTHVNTHMNADVNQHNAQYMMAQNLAAMTPLRDRRDVTGATPCSSRIANLQWVRNCLDFNSVQQAQQLFRKVFSLTQKQGVVEYQNGAKQQLLKLVQEFTPKCIKKDKRVEDIFSFFRFFVIRISQSHNEQVNAQMFRNVKTFNSILCLSSDMFNFAHSSLISSYRKQCQYFNVPLIQALKPINWIGKNVDKPTQINNYLYSLEKRIVIRQIWQDQTGYNLIRTQQQYTQSYSIGYNDMVIWRRLVKHILDRIQQLSKQVKLQHKLIKRVQNLVQQILRQKPYLLNKNKIDQIIICCMTSFLSINQIHQQQTLQKVFKDYNKIQLSQNQNKQSFTLAGRQMTLSQFYNQIFLGEIQDIVRQNIKDTDFLLTPIRHVHQQIVKNEGQMTPFAKKYKQSHIHLAETDKINGFSYPFTFKISANSQSNPLFKNQDSSSYNYNQLANYRKKLFIKNKQQMQKDESSQKVKKSSQNISDANGNNQMCEQIKNQSGSQRSGYKNQ